ncbi:MAG: hypothetical protein LBV53_02435, partial [Mycoplasmataceae bacterium]|nr:hypothetical protein [Mycoplasmataceae bacterium]
MVNKEIIRDYINMNNEEIIKAIDEQIKEIDEKLNDPNLAKGTAVSLARVSGYVRIVGNYNRGKREEAIERLTYELANSKST